MAFSKADQYAPDEQRVGDYLRALGHPARQRILKQLNKHGILTVEELRREHPLSEATMSWHLKCLRIIDFTEANEQIPYTYYNMNRSEVEEARRMINEFFDMLLGDSKE
jgi:ArsR family transcriptional regulator